MKYKHVTLLMLGLCSVADAQERVKVAESSVLIAPAEEEVAGNEKELTEKVEGLMSEAIEVQKEFMKRVRAVKDRVEGMKLYQRERPDMKKYTVPILELARKNPQSVICAKGLNWGFRTYSDAEKKEVLDLMMEHHQDGDFLLNIVSRMARDRNPNIGMINRIIKDAKNAKLVMEAKFALASIHERSPEKKGEVLRLLREIVGSEDAERLNAKLFKSAKQKIYVAENLAIGKVAPEIVGTDEDDKEFKLSDYRGKVVLLDFWGIW